MSLKDLKDAIAARAAGEDLPGIDPAALDARLAADPELRADLDNLARLCEVLRGAPVPNATPREEGQRHRPLSIRKARRAFPRRPARRFPWRLAIPAAAAALVAVALIAYATRKGGEPPEPPVAKVAEPPSAKVTAPPAVEVAVPHAVIEALDALREPLPGKKEPGDLLVGGGPGGGPAETSLLEPVLAQVGFPVTLPRDLPEDVELREARIRRAAVAGQDIVWLVWEGPSARLVLIVGPAAPGVREALGRAKPPVEGAVARIVESAGTVSLTVAVGLR
jgi:hypothetical protein